MKISLLQKALKVGHLPLVFRRVKGEWAAMVPSKLNPDGSVAALSKVALCNWGGMTLRRLRFEVASRYHAQVFENSTECHVNLRWAMKLPNWAGRFGALPELANAMRRAGLLTQ